jgi:hypothetical protein
MDTVKSQEYAISKIDALALFGQQADAPSTTLNKNPYNSTT